MKRFVLSPLIVLLLAVAVAPTVRAESGVESAEPHASSALQTQLRPFDLATLAYRGYFKNVGIPAYSALSAAYQSQQVTAKDLLEAAVKTHRLPASATTDKSYQASLDRELGFLTRILN